MKLVKISLLIIAAVVVVIIIVSYVIWLTYPSARLSILIIDKTVHNFDYSQHRSFVWVLNNARILKSDGGNYNVSDDYYGFHPLKPLNESQYDIKRVTLETVDSLAEANDVLYITDTYGVYFNEWFRGFRRGGDNSVIEGGINQNDFLLLKLMKEKNKLLIGEYNILGGTTSELNKYKTEELFGIRSTGWCAKYFESLDTSNSDELVEIAGKYTGENGEKWEYQGDGIVLVNKNRVVVLESELHLKNVYPVIITSDSMRNLYKLPSEIKYNNWIEINTVADSLKTISNFKLDLTKKGEEIMNELGLSSAFPAVTLNDKNGKNLYYFCADFSNNEVITFLSRLANSRKLLKRFTFDEKRIFFNDYYFPLIENILLKEAYNKKAK